MEIKIHEAANYGKISEVLELIKIGHDVNEKDSFNRTALMWASRKDNLKMTKTLLKHGADVNAVDNNLRSALFYAENYFQLKQLKLLVKHEANLNLQDKDGCTALMLALKRSRSHKELILLLMKKGTDLNLRDKDGRTTLMLALQNNWHDKDIISFMIKQVPDLNLQDKYGWTALMHSMTFGEMCENEIANLLIQNGADAEIKNNEGKTSEDILHDNNIYLKERNEARDKEIEDSFYFMPDYKDSIKTESYNKFLRFEVQLAFNHSPTFVEFILFDNFMKIEYNTNTEARVVKIIDENYAEMFFTFQSIFEKWDDEYYKLGITLDGFDWNVVCMQKNETVYKKCGDNSYPSDWKKPFDFLEPLISDSRLFKFSEIDKGIYKIE